MRGISIIIPTYNEQGTIAPLIQRLAISIRSLQLPYEIIIVDDHSTDGTYNHAVQLTHTLPVQLLTKKGKRGKAYSLLQGFSHAQYDVVAMIDGDLQYPPESLPALFHKLSNGYDIVVADRKVKQIGFLRNSASKIYHWLFTNVLFGISVDVQSGMKVFRKEILDQMRFSPTPWTFDTELIVYAKQLGLKIGSVPITFQKRIAGKSKINLLSSTFEIALHTLSLKLSGAQVIVNVSKNEPPTYAYKGNTYKPYTALPVKTSAIKLLSKDQKIWLLGAAVVLLLFSLIDFHATIVMLIAILMSIYFADLLLNIFLIYRGFSQNPEVKVDNSELAHIADTDWPTYTILCPLYKEGDILEQFVTAIDQLDYPKEKLQVLLLLEKDDWHTINKAYEMQLPSYFSIAVVPDSQPKTKPKACNYGLSIAKGEYVVIFDAEDVPEPLQLKKVIRAFAKLPSSVMCVQAKLNFYNPYQNLITRLFTAEYSLWFDLVLTGLQSIHAPIPLGGTSNHFRTVDLRTFQGWDPFNVTEDCDLGIRMVENGRTTSIIDAVTLEEANSKAINWFRQRTRWIKGYMQTYIVHMRSPLLFIQKAGLKQFLIFQLVVGAKILSMLLNPFLWITTIIYFLFRPTLGGLIESFFPKYILYIGVTCLLVGNFLYLYYYMLGLAKRQYYELIKFAFFVPIYWIAMSIAAWRDIYELIYKPHYWAKTQHGLHLNKQKAASGAGRNAYGKTTYGKFSPELSGNYVYAYKENETDIPEKK